MAVFDYQRALNGGKEINSTIFSDIVDCGELYMLGIIPLTDGWCEVLVIHQELEK